jgi:hypothetical protein
MTFLQAAGLGVRIFALWFFILSFQSLAVAFTIRATMPDSPRAPVAFAPAALTAFVGLVLWMFPLTVARAFVPRGAEQATAITLREAWRLGSVLVGLLVLAEAGPALLQAFALLFFNSAAAPQPMAPQVKADLVYAFSKTAVGLLLVLGSGFVHHSFGPPPEPAPKPKR